MRNHDYFMSLAIEEAKVASKNNEVPVGAIIVANNNVVSSGHNLSIENSDPTSHAEINALRNASKIINNYRMPDYSIYVTLEPCMMCYGALVHARVSEIFFGAYDKKTGCCGSCLNPLNFKFLNHQPKITGGIMEKECADILKNFFRARRD